MIRFYAQMYNATSDELYDTIPLQYSIAYYFGYTGSSDKDVMSGKSGQTLTDVPYSMFEGSRGSNIGNWFEYYAKKYYDETGNWPLLQLKTGENYILQWNHDNSNSFSIITPTLTWVWDSVFQWTDAFNPSYTDNRKYNYWFSNVFVKADAISDLINSDGVIYSGSYRFVDPDGFEVLVAYNPPPTVTVTDASCYFEDADAYLGGGDSSWGRRDFYKLYDGPSIYIWGYVGTSPDTRDWQGVAGVYPIDGTNARSPLSPFNPWYTYNDINDGDKTIFQYGGINWAFCHRNWLQNARNLSINVPMFPFSSSYPTNEEWEVILDSLGVIISSDFTVLYDYLTSPSDDPEPPTDVDPDDIPPEDEPPSPVPPDDQDPYYDPTSDPENPDYDPTKDPENPEYDPTQPHTPYRPPSKSSDPPSQEEHPPQDPISTPETPPSYVTTNGMFTLYNPSGGDLTNLANFLWSPTWSIDTFKKIFANPLDCILGLMVMPHLSASVDTKVMNVGNISTGVTMHYFTKQFYDFDCGEFELMEYYNSYLDYAPYTKVNIYLPYIGDKQLSTDEVMNKTLGVKYRFDLATGDCVAFIEVDGTVLYSFSGNCAARLPLAGNNWNGIIPAITGVAISAGSMAAGLPALGAASAAAVSTMKETISHTGSVSGSPGLMGIQTPYLIVNRPRQALPIGQNSFTGYPSFITESLGSLTGYTEVEQCHLEHVPATGAELEEIERLLKEGVLF